MAKYRKASEGSKKGISTDKLSLADAKEYFQGRAKETGAKRFRWNGDVYDLSGNKVSEAPARSSGGGSSRSSEGPKRPKANPTRQPGGARPEPGKAAGMPAAPGKSKPESPGKRGEANPFAVAGMAAAGVGAGVAAARSGRKAGSGTGLSVSDRVRAAGAKAKAAAMGVPAKNQGRGNGAAETARRAKDAPKVQPARPVDKPKVKSGGGGRGGRAGIGIDLAPNTLEQIKDPLNLMNKGGMVKKKK